MQLFALFTLAAFFTATTTLAAPILAGLDVSKAPLKLPLLPLPVPIVGAGSNPAPVTPAPATVPKTGGTGTGAAAVLPPALITQIEQYIGGLKPAGNANEAVAVIKKIEADVVFATAATVGALRNTGTKYPQSINPAAYLLRNLEKYVASLPRIIVGDSQFKAAATSLDKSLADLFTQVMDGASGITPVNTVLQGLLGLQILTTGLLPQTLNKIVIAITSPKSVLL